MTDQSPKARSDFRSEMWLAVHEGGFLFEVATGATDLLPDGPVVHGPWIPSDCSAALLTWFDHGWVCLVVPPEQLSRWQGEERQALVPDRSDASWHVLERTAARDVLADPGVWVQSRPEGFLCLGTTDIAPSPMFRDLWLDVLTASV